MKESDRIQRRRELYAQNLRVFQELRSGGALPADLRPQNAALLDGSLKKNTAMVNKLKTITEENSGKLVDELKKLRFDKFLAEMVSSLTGDALGKLKAATGEIHGFLEICTALHQRSADFAGLFVKSALQFGNLLPVASGKQQGLPLSDARAEKDRVHALKMALRVAAEAVLFGLMDAETVWKSGLIPAKQVMQDDTLKTVLKLPGGFVYFVLREYLKSNLHLNTFMLVTFCKFFANEYCLVGDGVSEDTTTIPMEVRTRIHELVSQYTTTLLEKLKKDHIALQKMKQYFMDYEMTRGDLNEQQKERQEQAKLEYEALLSDCTSLSASLKTPMPELKTVVEEKSQFSAHIFTVKEGEQRDWSQTPWEDEEQMYFYTDVPDIGNFVPEVSLKQEKPPKKKKAKLWADEDDEDFGDYFDDVDEEEFRKIDKAIQDAETNDTNQTTVDSKEVPVALTKYSKVDNVLLSLPNLVNKSLIDQAAVEFCNAQTHCKSVARQKLIETLVEVPRYRIDLLPYYSRLIANLNPYMPEIGATVVATLQSQFRRLFWKQHPIDLENRFKNIRFLGELVKFQICPTHILFYCFRRLLHPERVGHVFGSHHIEVTCHLLESCGRFMMRTPDIAKKWGPMVTTFSKKCEQFTTETRLTQMVDNALIVINPQPREERAPEKPRPLIEFYIRRLLFVVLNKKTVDDVLIAFRKLSWTQQELELFDPNLPAAQAQTDESNEAPRETQPPQNVNLDVPALILKYFCEIWRFKYNHIYLMADIAAGLVKYHSDFGVALVDYVLESIRLGMEEFNDFQFQQRRILMVKYLGELYNYTVVTSALVFDTLYSLIFFGHPSGRADPEFPSAIDPPNDFFRVRLVCVLLETCGRYFDRGLLKKRLDLFLTYFQHYILCKEERPMEIDFLLQDTFNTLAPTFELPASLDEARIAVEAADARLKSDMGIEDLTDNVEEINLCDRNNASDSSSEETSDDDDDDEEEDSVSSTGDDDGHLFEKREAPPKDEQFSLEFQRVVAESLESRRTEKRPGFLDVSIPMSLKKGYQSNAPSDSSAAAPKPTVQFALLTKGRGSKQTVKSLEVPLDSDLAVTTRHNQEAIRDEQRQLKRLVLNYQQRSAEEDRI